jgi:cation transport ATPase
MSADRGRTASARPLWPGQALCSLLMAGGVLMPYAPWLISNGLVRLIVMLALLVAGVLLYGIAIRRSDLPRTAAASTPVASRMIFLGVIGLTLLSSLVIESIHAPLWFPLLIVVAALLFVAFHLDARSRAQG